GNCSSNPGNNLLARPKTSRHKRAGCLEPFVPAFRRQGGSVVRRLDMVEYFSFLASLSPNGVECFECPGFWHYISTFARVRRGASCVPANALAPAGRPVNPENCSGRLRCEQ